MTDLYRARIYLPGSTSLTTGNVDFTIGSSQFAEGWTPAYLSPTLDPLRGHTEGTPWSLDVVDVGQFLTAELADSSGRMDWINRLVVLQRNRNGAGYSNLGVGRVQDLFLNDDVASYRIVCSDERQLERRALMFTTNTTRIYPGGPHTAYGPFPVPNTARWTPYNYLSGGALIRIFADGHRMPPAAVDQMAADIREQATLFQTSSGGNFRTVRLRLNGTDYGVREFPTQHSSAHDPRRYELVGGLRQFSAGEIPDFFVRIVATSSQLNVAPGTPQSGTGGGFLHMFTHKPTEVTPLHIDTDDPADIAVRAYQGDWSSSQTALPRVSTASAVRGRGQVRFRITDTSPMGDWLETHIYQPFGFVPVPDSSGVLTFKNTWQPESTGDIAFTFTGANLADPHPLWAHNRANQVTALRFEWTHERAGPAGLFLAPGTLIGSAAPAPGGAADHIIASKKSRDVLHDRHNRLGHYQHTIQLDGMHTVDAGPFDNLDFTRVFGAQRAYEALGVTMQRIARELFVRYGDGPIHGDLAALSTAESVEPGDFAAINLGTFPNPSTLARGGTRVVQVTAGDLTGAGPNFQWVDVGKIQPLAQPTLTLSTSTGDPRHTLRATIGSLASTSAHWLLQLANGVPLPSSGSTAWFQARDGNTTGIFDITGLPGHFQSFWARVRQVQPGRLPSPWRNSTVAKVTAALPTPTISGTTAVQAKRATLVWTQSTVAQQYQAETFIDTSTGASFGTSNRAAILPGGSLRYTYTGLDNGTMYRAGVRLRDPFGGVGPADSTTFDTSTSSTQLRTLRRFHLIQGTTV